VRGWEIAEVAWPRDIPAAVQDFGGRDEFAWLDSAAGLPGDVADERFSLICARPCALLEQFDGQPARLAIDGGTQLEDASGWRLWRTALSRLPRPPRCAFGLAPGWVGYVGFEMARQLERLPCSHQDDFGLPWLRLALFERGIVLDHRHHRAFALHAPSIRPALGLSARPDPAADWMARWQTAATARRTLVRPRDLRLSFEIDSAAHQRAVARALDYIAAGDIYQVNLAQRLRLEGCLDPLSTYLAVRRSNPAPYAALLQWPEGAVASVSPELFLRLRGGAALTCPIKGTRPRTGDPVLDEIGRQELLNSAKDAAELTMIVDLHRNDLGRVCQYGSVRVVQPRRIETHPTVFHTVADIVGELRPERDALDLLSACFPAGSVTGVPKIRAMQIIDELEPVARGVYTGAIGVLGLDGALTFNVAIRTLQMRGETATLYVGGGIVADSDPAAEYDETLAKARGILAGLLESAPAAAPAGSSAST